MRKTKKNMKFKNKKKNYYKRLPLLAKAGMIANRSSRTTVPKGKPVGKLSSLFRSSSVPVGAVIYQDAPTRDSLYPVLQDEPSSSVPVGTVIYPDAPTRNSLYPVLPDEPSSSVPMGLPVSLYPSVPITPSRGSSISSSEGDYLDAYDPIDELKKAKISADGAQRAAAKATEAREAAEAYVRIRQQAVSNFTEYARSDYGGRSKDWDKVEVAKVRLANARQALEEATTKEAAAVALVAEREKELLEARIKANEFNAATNKSLSLYAIDATRRIARAVSGSTKKSKAHK